MCKEDMADMAPQSLTTFGDLLRYLRQRAQLTQEALGSAVGYSRAHVVRLENNQRAPDVVAVRARFPEALQLDEGSEHVLQLIQLAVVARETFGDALASVDVSEVERTKSSSPIPNNLPTLLTSFVGRTRELLELENLLPTTRLLTLTGIGGVGKTRLAFASAAQLLGASCEGICADGVWVAELAPLSDPVTLPQLILAVLGVHEAHDRPALTTLIEALHSQHVLLILDNCEHMVEACAHLVEAVLRQSPGVRILTTSRETLGIAASWSGACLRFRRRTQSSNGLH